MRIFGIPVSKPYFGLMWRMTQAQIDLMCADCSVTVYLKTDKMKGDKAGKTEFEFSKPAKGALEGAKKRWQELQARKARGEDVGLNLSEFEPMQFT